MNKILNKTWHLKAKEDLPVEDDPWEPWYGKCHAMVIVAPDEETARCLAQTVACEEGPNAWIDSRYSTCEQIEVGETHIVVQEVRGA